MKPTPLQHAPIAGPFLDAARLALSATAGALIGEAPVLVAIAPHPDDETLGCGALLHAAARAGVEIRVICLTDGSASHPRSRAWPRDRLAAQRQSEIEAALAQLAPAAELHWIGERDSELPARGRHFNLLAHRISGLIPEEALVLLPWRGDAHVDHQRGHDLGRAAMGEEQRALCYPVWGRLDPQLPVPRDMRLLAAPPAALAAKRRALACHRSQMSGLIDDDPSGFVMPPALQEHFLSHPEIYIAE